MEAPERPASLGTAPHSTRQRPLFSGVLFSAFARRCAALPRVARALALALAAAVAAPPDPGAMAFVAASAAVAPASMAMASFSGLRPLRLSCAPAPRVHLGSRARCLPRIQAVAQEATFLAVKEIIAEQLACAPEKITRDAKFVDLGADSLDTVEIMMALEEQFNIQLDQEAGEKIVTVGGAADLIQDVISGTPSVQ